MNRLFIHVYLDEDVSVLVATLLRVRGFEATSTQEAGRTAASDDGQLPFAAERRVAVLTHNHVHFEALDRAWRTAGKHHAGIIIATRRSPHELARRLLALVNRVTADEMDDQVRYI